jgi:hypothetical protein
MTTDRYTAWQIENQDFLDAVDRAVAAGERPPLFDPDDRYPDQVEPGMTIANPRWELEETGGSPRLYLNVTGVAPDPDDGDAVLIFALDGPPVRIFRCDPAEVITPETADLHEFLLIDAAELYARRFHP